MFYNTTDGVYSYLFTIGAKIVHNDNHKFGIQSITADGQKHTVEFTIKATGDKTTEFDSMAEAQGVLEAFTSGAANALAFRLFQPVAPVNPKSPLVIPQIQMKGGLNG